MNKNVKVLDGFWLRIIAMVTMVCDHTACAFLGNNVALRSIGRIAFPIYAFLIAEGFLHIKDDTSRVEKHISTLFILAVVSEFCYDVMEAGFNFENYMESQSVILALLLGFLALLATEKLSEYKFALLCVYIISGLANYLMLGNFNIVGPWLVIAFYWYLKKISDKPWISRFLTMCILFAVYLVIYFWGRGGMCDFPTWCEYIRTNVGWIIFHFVAGGILSLYSGELGYHSKTFSKVYTWFYPAHLLILGLICWLGFGGPM